MTQTILGTATVLDKKFYLRNPSGSTNMVQHLVWKAPIPTSQTIYKPVDMKDEGKKPYKGSISFRKARISGDIVMNPYSVWDKSDRHFIGGVNLKTFNPYYVARANADSKGNLFDIAREAGVVTSHYREQGDLTYWRNKFSRVAFAKVDTDIDDKVEHAKTKVLANLDTTYDLLTELAESHQTVELLAATLTALRHPLRTFKKEKDALYKAFRRGELKTYSHLTKRVADAWLMARYGILPLIGSVNDILKTLKLDKMIFHTERSYERIDVEDANPLLEPLLSKYFHEKASGSIIIRATAKDRYDVGNTLQLSDLIGFNFAKTAWEKIPYSFVLDWVINLNDYLVAMFGSQTRLSNARNACFSIRKDYRVDTFLRYIENERKQFIAPEWKIYNTIQPKIIVDYGNQVDEDILLRTLIVNSYERSPFNHNNLSVRIDASMNWKRWADSAALLFSQSRKKFAALR